MRSPTNRVLPLIMTEGRVGLKRIAWSLRARFGPVQWPTARLWLVAPGSRGRRGRRGLLGGAGLFGGAWFGGNGVEATAMFRPVPRRSRRAPGLAPVGRCGGGRRLRRVVASGPAACDDLQPTRFAPVLAASVSCMAVLRHSPHQKQAEQREPGKSEWQRQTQAQRRLSGRLNGPELGSG